MKRIMIALVAFLLLCGLILSASAAPLRAGGGSSGGGGGGGSSGGSSHSTGTNTTGRSDPFSFFLSLILFIAVSSGAGIFYRLKLSRHARNTKALMRMLSKKDNAWKYKDLQRRVKSAYFAIQRAWSKSDMTPAAQYMSSELFQSFQTKLAWMTYKNERNALKHIRLLSYKPLVLHDSEDDTQDHVWYYIRGRMLDHTVDTQTGKKKKGGLFPEAFEEYWQFLRTAENGWVLHCILQKDEGARLGIDL